MPLTNRKRRAQNKALDEKIKKSKDKDATNDGPVGRKASQHKYNEAHKPEKNIYNNHYNEAHRQEIKFHNEQYSEAHREEKKSLKQAIE